VRSVAWRPDGGAIATVGEDVTLRVYTFTPGSLGLPISDTSASSDLRTVGWSPDGKLLATGGQDRILRVYSFENSTLTLKESSATLAGDINSLQWSGDGTFIAIGTEDSSDNVQLFKFDRSADNLVSQSSSSAASGDVNEVRWTADGQLIAAGIESTSDPLAVYETLSFPQKNVIKSNTVYCNSGNACPGGIGISGSSIANLIIGNTAYSNPVPQNIEGGGPIVFTNYAFVTNIFNELFIRSKRYTRNSGSVLLPVAM